MAEGDDDNTPQALVFRLHVNAPRVVREVLLERGWEEFDDENQSEAEWNLYWRTSAFQTSNHDNIKPWQRLNHHPRTAQITKKDCLARHLKRMKGIYGSSYFDFSPIVFILPNDYTKFLAEYTKERHEKKSGYWICKPTDMSRGRGIFLFQDIKHLAYDCPVIVQKYITNPLLISGYKFDLRIYVCVTCFCPLTIYIYQEGLVRFATEKFSLSSLDNIFAHLTNTSINKYSTSYSADKERVGSGCKWTLGQFRSYLRSLEVDDVLLWQRIYNIVTMTLLSIAPTIPQYPNCFELFGFDILIDDTLKPWLLEVNFSPALSLECPNDVTVKKGLINDIIDLLNYKSSDVQRGNSGKDFTMSHFLQPSTKRISHGYDSISQYSGDLKKTCFMKNGKAKENFDHFESSRHPSCKNYGLQNECEKALIKKGLSGVMCNCNSMENSLPESKEDIVNRDIVSSGKTCPRKTLTSKLREKMNMPQRLGASKWPLVLNTSRAKAGVKNIVKTKQCRLNDYTAFPLYYILDASQMPPAHVGDFLLIFPFNQPSFLASKNGADVKSIIQEMFKIMQKMSTNKKVA
ncbi:probable tubulin polyglutamylase TTLL2 [Hyla sarda]|uniref:probable tubulin polyglutamylase TTLL2 n=1 Tax=Hyla sarda TaxID=327740 RepID=UPI0024C22964|nr:probable tubulin polyglutamylase TTLL2 [Hyla sarda]XP_056419327.1 probable tubulin polyglutamylase TTLL2 [Hyla sarda]